MKTLLVLLTLLTALPVVAGNLSGRVTVLQKSGLAPLKTFANCVVYIKSVKTPPPTEPALMEQRQKRFIPRLLAAVSGQEVRFLNAEEIRHNVFSPHPTEPFDLGYTAKGEYRSFRLHDAGVHKIYCNIHQKMIADIFVVPGVYHTTTDDAGRFMLASVPPGSVTIAVWHILGGSDEITMVISQEPVSVNFTVTSHKVIKDLNAHPNKFGNAYRRESSYDENRY